jgi:hypothetical protein
MQTHLTTTTVTDERTLGELIARDPGPEPDQPGTEFPDPAGFATTAGGQGAARAGVGLDGRGQKSTERLPATGSDAAEALRMAVAETRWGHGPSLAPLTPRAPDIAPQGDAQNLRLPELAINRSLAKQRASAVPPTGKAEVRGAVRSLGIREANNPER